VMWCVVGWVVPTFRIRVLTSFSRATFTMNILPSKRRESFGVGALHSRKPEFLCPVNLIGRNATDHNVRATKLTPIIHLLITFCPPAVVMTITPWLSLLIWLAGIQAASPMPFTCSRQYVIRATSVDSTHLHK
jgi:hypothetical protein